MYLFSCNRIISMRQHCGWWIVFIYFQVKYAQKTCQPLHSTCYNNAAIYYQDIVFIFFMAWIVYTPYSVNMLINSSISAALSVVPITLSFLFLGTAWLPGVGHFKGLQSVQPWPAVFQTSNTRWWPQQGSASSLSLDYSGWCSVTFTQLMGDVCMSLNKWCLISFIMWLTSWTVNPLFLTEWYALRHRRIQEIHRVFPELIEKNWIYSSLQSLQFPNGMVRVPSYDFNQPLLVCCFLLKSLAMLWKNCNLAYSLMPHCPFITQFLVCCVLQPCFCVCW